MKVIFEAFEPYPNYLQGVFAVSRPTIDFAKELRALGIETEFDMHGQKDVYWHKENCVEAVLSVAGIVVSVAVGLYPAELRAFLDRARSFAIKTARKIFVTEVNQIICFEGSSETRLSTSEMDALRASRSRPWVKPFEFGGRPAIPVYLEHSPRLVAFASDLVTDRGTARLKDLQFLDDEIEGRVLNGELRGVSFGGVVQKGKCNICRENYVECPHVAARYYDNVMATVELTSLKFAEFSLVAHPSQESATLTIR